MIYAIRFNLWKYKWQRWKGRLSNWLHLRREGGVAILIPSHPQDKINAMFLEEIPDYLVYEDRAYVYDRDGKPRGGIFGLFKTRVCYFRGIGNAHDIISYDPGDKPCY